MHEFTSLEIAAVHRMKHPKHGEDEDIAPTCLSKLVCVRSLGERVVGFHFVGPNAGEITQVIDILYYCTSLSRNVLHCILRFECLEENYQFLSSTVVNRIQSDSHILILL